MMEEYVNNNNDDDDSPKTIREKLKRFLSKTRVKREYLEYLSRASVLFIIHTIASFFISILFPFILAVVNVVEFSKEWYYFVIYFILLVVMAIWWFSHLFMVYRIFSFRFKKVLDFEMDHLKWVRILISVSIILNTLLYFVIHINLKYGSGCNRQYMIDLPCIITFSFSTKMWYWGLLHLINLVPLSIFIILDILYLMWLNIYEMDYLGLREEGGEGEEAKGKFPWLAKGGKLDKKKEIVIKASEPDGEINRRNPSVNMEYVNGLDDINPPDYTVGGVTYQPIGVSDNKD